MLTQNLHLNALENFDINFQRFISNKFSFPRKCFSKYANVNNYIFSWRNSRYNVSGEDTPEDTPEDLSNETMSWFIE